VKPKRRVYVPDDPVKPLTPEDIERLMEESERYREAMVKRLEKLDWLTGEDWHTRVK
jgi:integrase